MLVIGCDPGLVNSPTGFVGLNPETKEILWAEEVASSFKKQEHKIKDIGDYIEGFLLERQVDMDSDLPALFFIESFVMRGKGGETLQRHIGSLVGRVPYDIEVGHVQNSRVKLVVGGHGQADKKTVGYGVLSWFNENEESYKQVNRMMAANKWDLLDALAIAITGLETSSYAKV